MKNPTITIHNIGRRFFNYTVIIPRGNGISEIKGSAMAGEPIEIEINESNTSED